MASPPSPSPSPRGFFDATAIPIATATATATVTATAAATATATPPAPPLPPAPIPQTVWALRIPVHITHAHAPSHTPLVTTVPRTGYLALLLPRLTAYFGRACSSFHHDGVQLRTLFAGLLADLYLHGGGHGDGHGLLADLYLHGDGHGHGDGDARLPWRLVVGAGPEWDTADTFTNAAKEADFVRNGSAKRIMALSKPDTTALWNAVRDNDHAAFARVNNSLLDAPTALRNVPMRVYVPSSPPGTSTAPTASFKVVQTLVPPRAANRTPQTLGTALRSMLPGLFPSSRDPVLANVILHGAPVPFAAPLEELMREAAYPDGWLCLVVVLL